MAKPSSLRILNRVFASGLLFIAGTLCSCESKLPQSPDRTFSLGVEETTIGLLEGQDRDVLGEIGGLASDSAGTLFVLDFLGKQLRAYAPDGRFIDLIGREGDGPGEFKWPSHVHVLQNGEIAVLDEGHMKLAFFKLEGGEFSHVRDLRLPLMARSFCELGSNFFLLGLSESKIVHKIDRTGVLLSSFGDARGAPSGISERWERSFQSTSATGELACLESPRMVLVLPRLLPELRAFDLEGDSLWTLNLPDYSQTTRVETDRGTLQYNLDPETGMAHEAVSLVPISPGRVLAQFTVMRPGLPGEAAPIESRIIDLPSRSATILTDPLPRLSLVTGQFVVAWENLPFPRVRIFGRGK